MIIDYGAGNIKSLTNALDKIGVAWKVTSNPKAIAQARKVIMPGVGSAKSAMEELRKRDLAGVIQGLTVPFLGICLGMQLLFEWSDEGNTECLGIMKGRVKKFQEEGLKVPHVGWNLIQNSNPERFLGKNQNEKSKCKNILITVQDNAFFYFVHSYYCIPENKKVIIATTEYGVEFASAVQWRNFYGVQFHPEKSGDDGMKLLARFCAL